MKLRRPTSFPPDPDWLDSAPKVKKTASIGADNDVWNVTICNIDEPRMPIIDAAMDKVHSYLLNIHMLWQLGARPIA